MLKRNHIYWYCQFVGWSFYIAINSIFFTGSKVEEYVVYFVMLLAGIAISHGYRQLIVKLDVLSKKIPFQLIFIVVFSFIKGALFFMVIVAQWFLMGYNLENLGIVKVTEYVLNFSGVFIIWNIIYFGFHYFQNYRRAEINSLRYLAASRESELKSLKAQLNPHFIFNSMNSIRALIDEDPIRAKTAVTRLSNILRNTLVLERNREISLEQEMQLVNDYLDLEKIRYEERLNVQIEIDNDLRYQQMPPFIIQAQIENAIKHGISKFPGPGTIVIRAFKREDKMMLEVKNTGKLNTQTPLTGVGFKNSIQRIELLYGKNAAITIHEANDWVIVEIALPLK